MNTSIAFLLGLLPGVTAILVAGIFVGTIKVQVKTLIDEMKMSRERMHELENTLTPFTLKVEMIERRCPAVNNATPVCGVPILGK